MIHQVVRSLIAAGILSIAKAKDAPAQQEAAPLWLRTLPPTRSRRPTGQVSGVCLLSAPSLPYFVYGVLALTHPLRRLCEEEEGFR